MPKDGIDPTEMVLDRLEKVDSATQEVSEKFDAEIVSIKEYFDGKLADDGEVGVKHAEAMKGLGNVAAELQELRADLDFTKKQLDAPIHGTEKELADNDRKMAIELQRREHMRLHGNDEGFSADLDNLVSLSDYRSGARKLMSVGLETRENVVRSMTEGERKALSSVSIDSAFFDPEMLGYTQDCNIECGSMLDLYGVSNVSRSTFQYPSIDSYADIGGYACPTQCGADTGEEGVLSVKNGKTYQWRGEWCFNKQMLQEASFDFMQFMVDGAQRAYRIARNQALIAGDGLSEPLGWATPGQNGKPCFKPLGTGSLTPTHQMVRTFLSSLPVEYGNTVAIMHQNMFGYLASMVDNNGRFIFGDGLMGFSPTDVRDRIRISNCLPDPTQDNTLGSAAAPFEEGAFLMAAGNWDMAYRMVNRRPMFIEQYVGGSTAWCVKYQFGAEDGGFVGCCDAARILEATAAAKEG